MWFDTGTLFGVYGGIATGPIYGFSDKVVKRNCHAGTREWLFEAWRGVEGRDVAAVAAELGLPKAALTGCIMKEDVLSDVLGKYFQVAADFPTNVPFATATRDHIRTVVDSGRQVILIFGHPISGTLGHYSNVSHSGIVVDVQGTLMIRNQLNVTSKATRDMMRRSGLSTTVDKPLREIDDADGGIRTYLNGEMGANYIYNRPVTRPETRTLVWSHVIVLEEHGRSSTPISSPVLSCGGGREDDTCDPYCDDSFRAVSVVGEDNGQGCQQKIELRHQPLTPFVLLHHSASGWSYTEVYPNVEESRVWAPAEQVDKLMVQRITGDPCATLWWDTRCCFTASCEDCSATQVEAHLSHQMIPAPVCD